MYSDYSSGDFLDVQLVDWEMRYKFGIVIAMPLRFANQFAWLQD